MDTGTPSLLLALLKSEVSKYTSTPLEENIAEVVNAIEQKKPSLAKDVAQRKLYEALYSIIEKDYENLESATPRDPQNSILNSAIGMALENAISGDLASSTIIQALRDKLRGEIIAALDP